jgi:uncharacterized protein Smg (DUF494 family)
MEVKPTRLAKMLHHLEWNKERNLEEVKQEMRDAGYSEEEIIHALQTWHHIPQSKNRNG